MTNTPIVSGPAPMESGGGYNRRSSVQAAGLSQAVPLFEQIASMVSLPVAPEPIVIADYGSSGGRNSLAPIAAAIRALRSRIGPDRAISVVHTDLAANDFSALFRTLTDDPDSYLRHDPAAFASAIGRSFYQQVMPSASVTLAWSSWALQWLSRTPARILDQVHINASHDTAAIAAYAKQADRDWRAFLKARALELRDGGRLVVLTMALREGDFGLRPLVEAMYGALLDLVDKGLISSSERKRMAIPMASRSRENLAAPFVGNRHFAGLSLEHLEIFESEDQNWSAFGADRDAKKFGAKWATFSRGSVFPTLMLGLEGGRHDPRADKFVDRLETGLAARLAAAPQPMHIPLARIVLVKQDR